MSNSITNSYTNSVCDIFKGTLNAVAWIRLHGVMTLLSPVTGPLDPTVLRVFLLEENCAWVACSSEEVGVRGSMEGEGGGASHLLRRTGSRKS